MGIIDISELNIPPEKHEFNAAKVLAELGKDIKFIKPSNIAGSKTPDFIMDDKSWELKCPKGKSSRTIENNLRVAMRQSDHIILDLCRMKKINEEKLVREIRRQFQKRKEIKKIIIITKQRETIDIE